jgi:hypothetical protein
MPSTLQGRERLHCVKYQMVAIIVLSRNGHWFRIVSPSLVAICQYLSSTVRDLAPPIFLLREGKRSDRFATSRETICESNDLAKEDLN